MSKITNGWTSIKPKEFIPGDIICNRKTQEFLRLVVHVDDTAIWVVGLVHIALIQNQNHKLHPIFPIYFKDIESGKEEDFLRLGNLKDFSNYIDSCKEEVKELK